MLNLNIQNSTSLAQPLIKSISDYKISERPIEEQIKDFIIRDLRNLNWQINFLKDKIEISPPDYYDKEIIRQSMSVKRNEIIRINKNWIDKYIDFARANLANGYEALNSEIKPFIEVCETAKQHRLFRILRYYWSSPYSEYVGRRIRLIIRDRALQNKPVIGIAALGSPIIHIPERDDFIGWDKETRTNNLIYAMDAYVIGALPPYNHLLGGKLISYILASNEVRRIYKKKYRQQVTLINKRKSSDLVGLFTTSLYGKSSQYNKMKYNGELLYNPIGETKGFGTLHLTEETIALMRKLLEKKGINIGYKFGDGPSWRMRIIRTIGNILNFDSNFLLRHSFKRNIYYIPLAKNSIEFLKGLESKPDYYDYPMNDLVNFWKERWLDNRKKNLQIVNKVLQVKNKDFKISN